MSCDKHSGSHPSKTIDKYPCDALPIPFVHFSVFLFVSGTKVRLFIISLKRF